MKKIIKILVLPVLLITIIFTYLMFKNNIIDLPIDPKALGIENPKQAIDIEDKNDLYISLEKSLLKGEKEVSLINKSLFKDPNEIFEILESISYNNPKAMYYKGAKYSFGKLELFYSKPKEDILKHQKEIENIRKDFLENHINENMSDYDKVLEIHDYIIKKGEYDKRLLENKEVPAESYSTYGILSLGVGVCESYAKTMKYLLDGVGIESVVVVGKSRGENHAWNLVKLDEEYYHIDTTWDDPIVEDGQDMLKYDFFNLNDEEISLTHEWNREDYPEAKGEKYNYYIYNDLIVTDKNHLEEQIESALLQGKTMYTAKMLKFSEDIPINEIIENLGQKHFIETGFNAYFYSVDKEKGIISIELFYNL